MTDQRLILAAIKAADLSSRQFAEFMIGRDERTVRRWITGEVTIPPLARAWLERWLELSEAQRKAMVLALVRPSPPAGAPSGAS